MVGEGFCIQFDEAPFVPHTNRRADARVRVSRARGCELAFACVVQIVDSAFHKGKHFQLAMDTLVRQASSMADSVVASVSEGVQAVNEAIAAEIGREEQRIAADAELDDFIVAERLAQEEAEAAAAAAATALRDLQAVNVKLRSVNEVASPVGRRKSSTITLDAS